MTKKIIFQEGDQVFVAGYFCGDLYFMPYYSVPSVLECVVLQTWASKNNKNKYVYLVKTYYSDKNVYVGEDCVFESKEKAREAIQKVYDGRIK